MIMQANELAKRLHGREYRNEITKAECAEAKAAGLLVVYGASDDLTEFEGAYSDEEGACNGAVHEFTVVDGKLQIVRERDEEHELVREGWKPPVVMLVIEAAWCPKGFPGSWLIRSLWPLSSFDIMKDGELYCRGAVLDVRELIAVAA